MYCSFTQGQCNGRIGFFPSFCVTMLQPWERVVRVTHTFKASQERKDGLSLRKDQVKVFCLYWIFTRQPNLCSCQPCMLPLDWTQSKKYLQNFPFWNLIIGNFEDIFSVFSQVFCKVHLYSHVNYNHVNVRYLRQTGVIMSVNAINVPYCQTNVSPCNGFVIY